MPFVMIGVALTFGIFLMRLFQLQIIRGDEYQIRSERNSVRTVRLEAARGEILDRERRLVASTRPAFGVEVIPNELHAPQRTYDALGELLGREVLDLQGVVGSPGGRRRFQPIALATDLSYEERARVESHRYALPGVFTTIRPRRYYEAGESAAHLLGFIGEIGAEQLGTRRFADYRAGEIVGKSGLEYVLESHLRGRAGGRNTIVDVAGREMEVLDEVRAVRGGTAVLTLDRELQAVAEQALATSTEGETRTGAVVAMDVKTGDLLALVSLPAFDPNSFAGGIDSKTWQALRDDPLEPLLNRAITGQYPPGSTYKAVVAAAALEEGLITPEEKIYCPGSFRLGRRTYRCWKRAGHGWVDLQRSLVESCDVYYYQAGLRLGVDRIAFFARAFSLGRLTGIPIPNEQPGLVPTTAWKERRFGEPWHKGETVSTSIGQGYNLMTPIQLAVIYAAIANGGALVEPRVVRRLETKDGALVREYPPVFRGTVPVRPENLQLVRDAMEGVVSAPNGTGSRARVPGVRVAGKTGTAQVVRLKDDDAEEVEIRREHRDHAWFVAYAPVEAPEIVVAVLVEHGGHGGATAGPVAQAVLAHYFASKVSDETVPVLERSAAVETVSVGGGDASH